MSGFNAILNNDSGLVARTKLNEMLEELFEAIVGQLWVDDEGTIKPKDDAPVEIVALLVQVFQAVSAEIDDATINSGLLLAYLTGAGEEGVGIGADGALLKRPYGWRAQSTISGNGTLDLTKQICFASPSGSNSTLTLPEVTADLVGYSCVIQKYGTQYSVILTASGGQLIAQPPLVSGSYAMATYGEWVVIRAVETSPSTYGWAIERFGGRATIGGGGTIRGIVEVDSGDENEYNIEPTFLVIKGKGDANLDLFLPTSDSVGIIDFYVRKTGGSGALSLFTTGGDDIVLDDDDGAGIYTTTIGGWVHVMCDGEGKWHVVAGNDEFDLTV